MNQIDLSEAASQTRFAQLVGVSQQAISKQIEKGVLPAEGTYGEWLTRYVEHLREQAAGRGGDQQAVLTQARTEAETVKAALGRLQYHEKLGQLVHKELAAAFLSDWAGYANREFGEAFERLLQDIKSAHGIEVSAELREKHAGATVERVRGYALKLGVGSPASGGDIESAEDNANQGMD